jgi:hypothetical protein
VEGVLVRTARRVGLSIAAALALAPAVAGCASADPNGADLPLMPRGSKVVVYSRWPGEDPFPTADRYCATQGRSARPRNVTATSSSFDCVPQAAQATEAPRASR